jgi:beta-lactamase class A
MDVLSAIMRSAIRRSAARSSAWLVVACVALAACASAKAEHHASATVSRTAAIASSTPPPSGPTPTRDPAAQRARVTAELAEIARHEPRGSISVAAMNLATGAHFAAGRRSGMWTASAYKLFVLETLLLQHGGPLSGYEDGEAERMIENSDNPAGYSLFLAAGGNAGLEAAARRFGMKHTVPGASDPTFTRTSAGDFLILARNLASPHSPLTASARKYALSLMADVEADQRWGVSAVADKDSSFYNKNGWLSIDDSNGPGETDGGRWAVTSIGIVQVHHQRVLMSIFTQHQPLMGDGVRLIERLAKVIGPAVAS